MAGEKKKDTPSNSSYSKIQRPYKGFLILAQSERDFKSKCSSIDRGDVKGFIILK